MSNIVKVFIVLNFVLSVVFIATAATLLGKAENWKDAHDKLKKETTAQIKTLNEKVSSLLAKVSEKETARQTAVEERSDCELKLTSTRQQLTEQKRTNEKLSNNLAELKEAFKTQAAALKQAQTDRETYAKRMETAEEKARHAIRSKETAEDDSRRFEANVAQLKEEIAQLERDLNTTRNDLDHQKNLVKMAIEQGFDLTTGMNAPPIEAVVQIVNNELKYVMLSVGREDKVRKGMLFHVSRNGSYVGDVQVDSVYPNTCSASFKTIKPGMTIEQGDTAATRLW